MIRENAGPESADEAFAESVRARVRTARAALAEAVEAHDGLAVQAAMDELEDALATARKERVEIPAAGGDTGAASGGGSEKG